MTARPTPYARGTNPYLRDNVETASPGRLLVMLYDRLSLDLERAETACCNEDFQTAHDTLLHAQDILSELHATLDVDAWEPGKHLAGVYEYLLRELCDANITKDAKKVASCRRVIAPLHTAWREAAGVVDPPVAQPIGA